MSEDRVPVFALANGAYDWHFNQVPFAYHLENRRFVRYLHEEAVRAGVKHLDCVVRDATICSDRHRLALGSWPSAAARQLRSLISTAPAG